jgi:hypothetical protein
MAEKHTATIIPFPWQALMCAGRIALWWRVDPATGRAVAQWVDLTPLSGQLLLRT